MSPTSIGIELDNNENEMEKSKDNNSEEEQTFIMEKPKFMKLKDIKLLFPQRNTKMINIVHQ